MAGFSMDKLLPAAGPVKWFALLILAWLFVAPAQASLESRNLTMCVFDPQGTNGLMYGSFQQFRIQAMNWGVKLELKPYRDDRIAVEDFKAGVCDLVNMPGIRARAFNKFTGTIDSIGAIPDYAHLKMIIDTLASEKAAPLMINGDYEVVSIIPAGAIYLFVHDKAVHTPETMAGKTIGVLDNVPELPQLVALAGMTPVASSITNLYSKFNNRSIDITAGPAVIYGPMELYRGMDPDGGVLNYPFMQATIQVVGRYSKLPAGFGAEARRQSSEVFRQALDVIEASEAQIPEKYWVRIPQVDSIAWSEVFRQSRIELRDKGIYDAKALKLFRKVRCNLTPVLPECTAQDME